MYILTTTPSSILPHAISSTVNPICLNNQHSVIVGSVSSMNAVEDTHDPPLNNVIFNCKGVVIEEYSERIRQDPVGGE